MSNANRLQQEINGLIRIAKDQPTAITRLGELIIEHEDLINRALTFYRLDRNG